jgi:TetR/AcrR family transcriptional regulator, transcriptional repressor for nem operon
MLIRQKGYCATSVDEICAKAGVTKGAFFHHFPSKDALGVAAVQRWSEISSAFFAAAPYHKHSDPLDRVLGYLDFRKENMTGEVVWFSCLVGTMVQELYGTNDEIREACDASISGHASELAVDIAAAIQLYGLADKVSAKSLALHTQAVLQGAFILAKAKGGAEIAAASVEHLRRYIELLFKPQSGARKRSLQKPQTRSSSNRLPSSTTRSSARCSAPAITRYCRRVLSRSAKTRFPMPAVSDLPAIAIDRSPKAKTLGASTCNGLLNQ